MTSLPSDHERVRNQVVCLRAMKLFIGIALLLAVIGQATIVRSLFIHNFAATQIMRTVQEGWQSADALDKAAAWGHRALEWSPTDWSTRRLLSYIYLQAQQVQYAAEILGVNDADCPDVITCYQHGQALYQLGRYEEAIAVWQSVPNTDVYFAFQGDLAYEEGNKSDAFQFYDISWHVADTPAWPKTTMLLNLCRERRSEKEMEQAIYWCEQAVISRSDYWTRIELGRTYYESRQYEPAEETLRDAIQLLPDEGSAYNWWGLTLLRLGREQEGIEALYTSVRLAPENIWARLDLANTLASQGEHRLAACEYTKVLELTDRPILIQDVQQRIASLPIEQIEPLRCDN